MEAKKTSRDQPQTHSMKNQDTHSYRGWLNSDNFLKRSFAIWGYQIVANLIISIGIFAFFILLFSLFAGIGVGIGISG